jgi:hypothetical protein
MDDFCHVFVLTSLSIDENGDVKRRNVAVTFDLFEAEDHRNRGVEHEYDVFVVPGDWRDDAEESNLVQSPPRPSRDGAAEAGGAMRERAQAYLDQGKTVYAAGLMLKLVETEPTPENLTLLAEIYMAQGLFDHAKQLYLRVVKAGLK